MFRVAVFIDAGYLWKQLCKALTPKDKNYSRSNVDLNYSGFHDALTEYVKAAFPGIPLLRCYWYDGAIAGGALSSDHNRVAALNDFKLRLGSRVPDTSNGKTRQKGVDGLIIADLIGLAQNKVLSHALLISGDGDMVPGVGVAQALGVRIHLLAVHADGATSPQLKMEVDFFDSWQNDKISEFAKARTPSVALPQEAVSTESSPQESPSLPPVTNAEEAGVSHPAPTSPLREAYVSSTGSVFLSDFFNSLSDDEKQLITQTYIPYDIDRHLIRFAYEHNNYRALTETEKRYVRNILRELAQQPRR